MKRFIFFVLICVPAFATAKPLNVVVTINPIYSLVKNVVGDTHNVHLLINKTQSPHTYQLRPSDVSKLNKADLIFTIGNGFEVFLFNYIHKSNFKDKVIEMVKSPGLKLLPIKERTTLNLSEGKAAATDGDDHGHDHEHRHSACHHHSESHQNIAENNLDWHFWGNPENAKALVRAIADAFSKKDPANAQTYELNALKTIQRLTTLDATMSQLLSGLAQDNFVVMHDGYQYLERRYGLSNVGTVIADKNFTHSARKLEAINKLIKDNHVRCVFIEPQVSGYLMNRVSKFLGVKPGLIDIEWGEFNQVVASKDLYFFMMETDARHIAACLSAQ